MVHLLEADNITLKLGFRYVLREVYLKALTGKVVGILGRNGSGKSCLQRIIYGSMSVPNKTVRIDGKSLLGNFRDPEKMRYLPQHFFIPKHLDIKQVFQAFEGDFEMFLSVFPEFKAYYKTSLGRLSGGERRIVEVYAVLTSPTQFCLLDEPFAQLMPLDIERVKALIMKEKVNKGIIITDHLYREIVALQDELYVITGGRIYPVKDQEELELLGYIKETNEFCN